MIFDILVASILCFVIPPASYYAVAFGTRLVDTIRGALQARRDALKHPRLNGVPLPRVDHPKWKHVNNSNFTCLGFMIWKYDAEVSFQGTVIGKWRRYERAVAKHCKASSLDGLAERAAEALVGR